MNSLQDLETAFLNAQSLHGNDGTGTIINEKSDLLTEIIVSLIRGYLPKSKCTIKNYQLHLHPILANYKPTTNNLIADYKNIDFPEWPLSIKIDCLQLLCEIRLNADDISPIFSELVADSLRVKPLGTDSHGSIYWYFFETRLYREDRKENSSVCQWQLLCETEVDWINLLEKLAEFRADKNLYHLLDDIFRSITRLFRRKALAQQRKYVYFAFCHNINMF